MLLTVIRTLRIPFLLLAPVCVLLGVACAMHNGITIHPLDLALILLGALSAHVSVNTFNEYHDFRSGLDAMTERTPFSGGSGGLQDEPQAGSLVHAIAIASLLLTILIGMYFLWLRGPWLLLPGLSGVLLVVTYTGWLTRHPWLCLLAPGVGFGPVMVAGSYYVLGGQYTPTLLVISLLPLFLVSSLLLLNQLPDLEADRQAGRRHFAIAYGSTQAIRMHGLLTFASAVTLIAAIRSGMLPATAYGCLVPLSAALLAWLWLRGQPPVRSRLLPALALNVAATLLTPACLALVLLLDRSA